ncbi:sulfurtransferase TusA family protein [Thiohalomonas denitrificans]|uniref:tRNA 2-thiouridine synthesizing protein A n=1 Tax=Thiohalomonas denitrificans TaxID=415747 RepID=A0A1G5QEH8_9GAMM|nr:sulfurtransferase TusA family protein [Thiohalomonas denitrificans]SCZ60006.1 tRNA 2-thiouridine synthesizing protein A [Thiohalomonas denitrificans]
MNDYTITSTVDTSGTCCPMPMVNTNRAIKNVQPGEVIEIIATDPATEQDIPDWCRRMGHTLIKQARVGDTYRYTIQRSQ